MSVLVAYSTKRGATRGIAEYMAQKLVAWGQQAEAKEVGAVEDPGRYQAFVIGSPVYFGAWRRDAARFVRDNQALLASRPVWLFSSGPIGTTGREAVLPRQIAEFQETIHPRDHKMFFSTIDQSSLGSLQRFLYAVPAIRDLLADFRDWPSIDAWAEGIARQLALAQATAGAPIPAL